MGKEENTKSTPDLYVLGVLDRLDTIPELEDFMKIVRDKAKEEYRDKKIKIFETTKDKKELCVRYTSKARGLEYDPINEYFEGAVYHHISRTVGMWIPEKLHKEYFHALRTNVGMDEINRAVFDWYEHKCEEEIRQKAVNDNLPDWSREVD